jgi:hypothetical protein
MTIALQTYIITFLLIASATALNAQAKSDKNMATEIVSMSEESLISDDILNKYDGREIGRAIVKRVQIRETSKSDSTSGYYDFKNSSQIMMVISEAKLSNILYYKKFLNCHQNTSRLDCNGYDVYYPATKMSGLRFPESQKAYEALPHYAYLMLDFNQPKIWRTRLDKMYGNVIAVFKNNIKDQVTFSAGNSWVIRQNVHTLDFKSNAPFPEPDYQREYPVGPSWGHHWEAQIWGLIELEDVDYFMVNCDFFGEASKKALDELRLSGKQVFQCLNDSLNSEIRTGEKLF